MLINKKNLAVAALASSDETRPALQFIRVTKEYTEAVDGHVFARVSNPKVEDDDFPVIPGLKRTKVKKSKSRKTQKGGFDECLIPANQAVKLAKMIPRGGACRTLPILEHVQLVKDGDDIKAVVTDLDNPTVIQIRQDKDMKYPNCDKIMPADKPVATICVNADLLIKVLKLAGTFDKDSCKKVIIEFRKPESALVLKADNDDQTFYGLVMPQRA